MCHGGYSYKYDDSGPIWKVTDDGQHIIFYGKYQNCPTSTKWCKDHCYLKTKPTKKKIDPTYTLDTFKRQLLKRNEELFNDLSKAQYITMFASGELGGINNFYDVDPERIIFQVCNDLPDKKIMFFVREILNFDKMKLVKPDNSVIVLSLDRDSKMDLINWGLDSELINSISIIDHDDNKRLINMLRSALPHTMECSSCKDFDCFGSTKGIILCEYQHRKL